MHVLGWLGFIFYENLVLIGLNIAGPDFSHIIYHFIINIGFFYAFSGMILHWAWRADLGDWWRIPLGFILSLAVYIAFKWCVDYAIATSNGTGGDLSFTSVKVFSGYLYRGVFFIFCALGYCYLRRFLAERTQKEILLQTYFNEKLTAETQKFAETNVASNLLYAANNMHHLFSTLNFIYLKLSGDDQNLAQLLLYTTDLIRYYLNPNTAKGLNLAKELLQVSNLIQMDRLMFPNKPRLHWSIEEGIEKVVISAPVLISVTLVLLRFSVAKENISRGQLSIFKVGEQVCFKGWNIQYIAEPAKLAQELDKINAYLLAQKLITARFNYQIMDHLLDFTLLFHEEKS